MKEQLSEKYRPQTFDEIVGQEDVVYSLRNKKRLNDMVFVGPAGSGKTTMAYILAKVHDIPITELNASDDRGIGVVRGEIKRRSTFVGDYIILLDEADSLTNDAQQALRRIMENSTAIFILTGNYGNKFLPPILSRGSEYKFKPLTTKQILKQIVMICNKEGIEIGTDVDVREGLKELARQSGGDMRKAINTLEKIVEKDNSITVASVRSLMRPNNAAHILKVAMDGNIENAQILLEKDIKENRVNPNDFIEGLYESIKAIEDKTIKAKLYYDLRKTAKACQNQTNAITPIIHILGFLSYAWILPHMPTNCPAMVGRDDE